MRTAPVLMRKVKKNQKFTEAKRKYFFYKPRKITQRNAEKIAKDNKIRHLHLKLYFYYLYFCG
jgi:ribosomal protein S21